MRRVVSQWYQSLEREVPVAAMWRVRGMPRARLLCKLNDVECLSAHGVDPGFIYRFISLIQSRACVETGVFVMLQNV